jgi:homocysteine S-methyltransferase
MPQFTDIFASRPVLADGAMGTVLYARGVFINRCYDELNLSDPGMILSIHEEYLQAGADILETNTFGANRFRLARHGLAGKVAEINAAGVRVAREAVAHLRRLVKRGSPGRWVRLACARSPWAKPGSTKPGRLLPNKFKFLPPRA